MKLKEKIRAEWQRKRADTPLAHWGKPAENLRRLQTYRNAATVFATPHDTLHQARINCLVDGKNLLMPGPSIREGFFILAARTVLFKDISVAVTYKGLQKHGQVLKVNELSQYPAGLLLTDSLAVDQGGGRIGDGNGYFDLCCAILQKLDGLEPEAEIMTFIQEEQLSRELLPQDNWDIKMTGAVTPARRLRFDPPGRKPQIFWDMLPRDRIKRIDPLFKLFQKRNG